MSSLITVDGTRFKIILVLLFGLIVFFAIGAFLRFTGNDIPDILIAISSIFGTQLGNSIVPYFKGREDLQAARMEIEKECKG